MSLATASLKRPIAMTTLLLVFLVFGIQAYRKLGLDFMPNVEIPFVTVVTVYPGATPQEIETDVAKKIEDAVVAIDGLRHVNSVCMENVCQTLLEFNLNRNVDLAAMDVREKINLIRNLLPEGVEEPEIIKFNINAKPVVIMALTGDVPLDELYDFADNTLKDRFSTLSGVAGVEITGGAPREIQVRLRREQLAARGLTSAAILVKLREENLKIPSGTVDDHTREISITFDAEVRTLTELGALEVGTVKGRRVYLRDVAELQMGTEKIRTATKYDDQPCIVMKIVKKGEANSVKVVQAVREQADLFRQRLPGGMNLVWYSDDGDFIQASMDDAWSNIFSGVLLTAIILLLFLQRFRPALIAFISMPVSIVITFAGMSLFGYTFNTSTLLAIGISVGILVTNSIVVLENIARKLAAGLPPRQAAMEGADEVLLPVFASAITNVVVFVPIAMMTSMVGQFFVPFAVTTTIATLVSLFISFTLTPILAGTMMKPAQSRPSPFHRLLGLWENVYVRIEKGYAVSLRGAARISWLFVLLTLAVFIVTVAVIAPRLGMGFFAQSDRGELTVKLEFPTDSNLNETMNRAQAMATRLRQLPEVRSTLLTAGKIQGIIGQASQGSYLAELSVKLTPKTARTKTQDDLRQMIRDALKNESNCLISVMVPDVIGGSSKQIELEISGPELSRLDELSTDALNLSRTTGVVMDVENAVRPGKPEMRIYPRRAVLQDMGVPAAAVGTMLRANLEGIKATTFKIGDRSYDIRVKMVEEASLAQVADFNLPSPGGRPLNLTTVGELRSSQVPVQITRAEKQRVSKLFADPAPGVALGRAVERIRSELLPHLPAGYALRFVGVVDKMAEAVEDFMTAIIIAIILTYLTLAALLESWTQPLLIMTTLPLAYIGLVLGLDLAGMPMSMMTLLAGVMLIGVVVNNAILIIDEVNNQLQQGVEPREAMLQAAPRRFRPILMTSLAAVIGMLPMALGTGLGSEFRAPCGVASVGGLLVSTLLSLYFVPLFYLLFKRKRERPPASPPIA